MNKSQLEKIATLLMIQAHQNNHASFTITPWPSICKSPVCKAFYEIKDHNESPDLVEVFMREAKFRRMFGK